MGWTGAGVACRRMLGVTQWDFDATDTTEITETAGTDNWGKIPTRRHVAVVTSVLTLIGLLLAAGATWIVIRTGGDIHAVVGSRRSVPMWFAVSVIGVLATVSLTLAVSAAVVALRRIRAADQLRPGGRPRS